MLDRPKQGQTLTERGSDPLMLQKLREGKCLPAGHSGPGWGRPAPDWSECQRHEGSVSILVLQTSPQEACLALVTCGGLSTTMYCLRPSLIPDPKTHPWKAFINFVHCNSDGHWLSSENGHCRLQEVTVITNLFPCRL